VKHFKRPEVIWGDVLRDVWEVGGILPRNRGVGDGMGIRGNGKRHIIDSDRRHFAPASE
jgi:hypothetical protein